MILNVTTLISPQESAVFPVLLMLAKLEPSPFSEDSEPVQVSHSVVTHSEQKCRTKFENRHSQNYRNSLFFCWNAGAPLEELLPIGKWAAMINIDVVGVCERKTI